MPDAKLTSSDHERERRAAWDLYMAHAFADLETIEKDAEVCACLATAKLAERDKIFPGPVECELVTCPSCGERVIAEDVSDQCFTKCQKCGTNLFVQAVKFDAIALSAQEDGPR